MAMNAFLKFPIVFCVGLVCTLLLVPLVSKLALHFNLVDQPGPRRLHRKPIPRIGGLAVFAGFHVACAALFLIASSTEQSASVLNAHWWRIYLLISSFVVGVGLWDDAKGMRPLTKLLCQITAATMMYAADIRVADVFGVDLPIALDLALTVFWFLAVTNAFNLIDGMDGLASGLASIASIGLMGSFLFRGLEIEALMMLGFLGACLGFLKYNFNPASIFLGDTGSMFIGFTIAAVALSTGTKGTTMASMGVPLLAVGVPMFDTMLAVWRRSVRRAFPEATGHASVEGGVMHFDMDHLHHRLIKSGLNQRHVAIVLYLANASLVVVGLLSLLFSSYAVGIFVLAFVLGTYVVVRHVAHVELWDSGVAILEGFKPPSNKVLAVLLYPLLDFSILAISLAASISICRYSTHSGFDLALSARIWFFSFPLWGGLTFISVFLARTYSRVWSRARIAEYVLLGLAVVAGTLVSWAASVFVSSGRVWLMPSEGILFCSLSIALISALRAFPRLVREIMVFAIRRPGMVDEASQRRIVVYGAGERGMLYLRDLGYRTGKVKHQAKVMALVDDDRNLRQRLVHGFKVVGGMRDLSRLLSHTSIDEIVLAASLNEKRKRRLLSLARQHKVTVTEWYPVTNCLFTPVELVPASSTVVQLKQEAQRVPAPEPVLPRAVNE